MADDAYRSGQYGCAMSTAKLCSVHAHSTGRKLLAYSCCPHDLPVVAVCILFSALLLVQAGSDVSASLTAWGSWQPGLAPTRGPTVLDALIGSLGSRGSNRV